MGRRMGEKLFSRGFLYFIFQHLLGFIQVEKINSHLNYFLQKVEGGKNLFSLVKRTIVIFWVQPDQS